MKCIVIGLGNYGSVLAEELTMLGHEVIGVDKDDSRADAIKDDIATTFVLDVTDQQALQILPLGSVDLVVVTVGENFEASIRAVALLKKLKVKRLYARAVDKLHYSVLEAFNLDKILLPEKDAARSLVQLLDLDINVESFYIDEDYTVVKFKVPASFVGYRLSDVAVEKEFNLKIIALIKDQQVKNSLGISILDRRVVAEGFDEDYKLEAENMLVCYGKKSDFKSFWKAL